MKVKDLNKYLQGFDFLKYPSDVYEELVFGKKSDVNKYIVLGAWKTGCLKLDKNGDFYTDHAGKNYIITNRWKANCPVGYDTWHYITKYQYEIEKELPSELEDKIPDIIESLIRSNGFGFIWAVFAAHCFKPEIYPLYDQHVYRAYISLQTNGSKKPDIAPAIWSEYLNYATFFNQQLSQSELNQADCDRALWSYGKSIKLYKGTKKNQKMKNKNNNPKGSEEGFAHAQTLGQINSFWWKVEDSSIHILRLFKGNL